MVGGNKKARKEENKNRLSNRVQRQTRSLDMYSRKRGGVSPSFTFISFARKQFLLVFDSPRIKKTYLYAIVRIPQVKSSSTRVVDHDIGNVLF